MADNFSLRMLADMANTPDDANLAVSRMTAEIPQQMPQNWVQRGNDAPIDLGPSQGMGPQQGPALDYSRPPVSYGGQKGYYVKGDPFTVVMQDGTRLSLGNDQAATRKRTLEELQMAKARQELEQGGVDSQLKRAQLDQLTRGGQGIPKLEKGEVWNAEAGRVDAAPGSSRFITQQGKFAADKKALDAVTMKAQGAIDKVDEILGPGGTANPGDGFKSNFGGYNAYLTQYLPGEASDKRKKIDSLKSDLRAAGLEMMRSGGSIGAMTEREWPIVEQMMAGISPVLSEMEAAFQLAKVKTKMQQIRGSAQEDYDTSWRNTQFGAQGPAASPAAPGATIKRDLSPQDAQALAWAAGNPGDPRAAQINAKLGVK